jgi:hypothetical protein
VVNICNPNTQEVEERKIIVQGQPGLYSETLSPKKMLSSWKLIFPLLTSWVDPFCNLDLIPTCSAFVGQGLVLLASVPEKNGLS